MNPLLSTWKRWTLVPALSPRGLLLWAARLALLLVVLHALGARADTTVLSGTLRDPLRMFLGLAYVISYFACAAFTPPLLLAAALSAAVAGIHSLAPRERGEGEGEGEGEGNTRPLTPPSPMGRG
jgi:hypothetical protein